jgi:hypothetical protein
MWELQLPWGGERKREMKKNLDEGNDAPGSAGTLSGSSSGQAVLKERTVGAVGEWSPQENQVTRSQKQKPQKGRNSDTPIGHSGCTALRRGAV